MLEVSKSKVLNVVCGILSNPAGQILAAQRATGSLAGKWEFPGGKIDPGETPEQAIVRELSEELGCEVEAHRVGAGVLHHYAELSIFLIPVWCSLVHGQPQATVHRELRWLGVHQLAALDWAAADVPILAQITHG